MVSAIREVTEGDLREYGREVRAALPELNPQQHAYVIAMEVADRMLGRPWVQRATGLRPPADPFIGTLIPGIVGVPHLIRVTELGETLFNLQRVPGFLPHRLIALKSGGRSFEAANLELTAGRFLKRAGIPFEYAEGHSRGRDTYELDFHVGGVSYPLEAKLKEETTACSAQTVDNALREARRQLPRGRTGIVFLGIPWTWTALSLNQDLMRTAIQRFLRFTTRIAAVVVVWRTWHLGEPAIVVSRS